MHVGISSLEARLRFLGRKRGDELLVMVLACVWMSVLGLWPIKGVQAQTATTLEQALASMPSELAADIRRRFAEAGPPPPSTRPLRPPAPPRNSEWLTAKDVTESVAATARCAIGYVVQGRPRASAADVVIVSEELLDCDVKGCRAFQVVAKRGSTEPFDLDVSVTCSK
jgi:hypothetical protein